MEPYSQPRFAASERKSASLVEPTRARWRSSSRAVAGGIVEMGIPGEGVEGAIGEGDADTPQHALDEELGGRAGLALGLLVQTGLDIGSTETAMSPSCAARRQFVAVGPQTYSGGMHAQHLRSLAQAQPFIFVCY